MQHNTEGYSKTDCLSNYLNPKLRSNKLNNKTSDLFPDENSPPFPLEPNNDFERKKSDFENFHTAPLLLAGNHAQNSSSPNLNQLYMNEPLVNIDAEVSVESEASIVSRNKYGSGKDRAEPETESDCVFQVDPNEFSNANDVYDAPDILKAEEPRKLKWAMDETLKSDQSEFDAIEPKAMKFPFELDDFQKQAIVHLQKVIIIGCLSFYGIKWCF